MTKIHNFNVVSDDSPVICDSATQLVSTDVVSHDSATTCEF